MISQSDTIAAISTPPGEGGVGIVRLSGPDAIDIAARIFRSARARDIRNGGQRVYYGHIVDGQGVPLDEVLLHIMRAPHSFTCEDVVEINGHAGALPTRAVLEEVLQNGARLASPGEFTQRAFLNGRIDLVQAEAIIDQIQARTRFGLQAAVSASSGALSKEIHAIRHVLFEALARLEAAVDFPEDDLPELVDAALLQSLRQTHTQMLHLLETADAGRLVREGATVAIAGKPNVGKSSLFNALLRDNRAIVTPHAGTTRDRLEEHASICGVPVRLIDTAGLRVTEDEVEQIGVARAREALQAAQVALFVMDGSQPVEAADQELAEELLKLEIPILRVLNKSDLFETSLCHSLPPRQAVLFPQDTACGLPQTVAPMDTGFEATISISALTGAGLDDLENTLAKLLLRGANLGADQAMLTRVHQKDSLRRAAECVERLLAASDLSPEFLALELQEALGALGEITGETTPDDVLEAIFGAFCIGK